MTRIQLAAIAAVLTLATYSPAQVETGIPNLSSVGGGPFDSVNLGNLNAHFVIPVLNKAGRGMPFAYSLTYDSSIWQPVTSSGTTSWTPVTSTNWGWTTSMPHGGHTSYQITSTEHSCTVGRVEYFYLTLNYINWVYYDGAGTRHPFAGVSTMTMASTQCGVSESTTGFTGTATDNSGYTITVNGSIVNSLVAADGTRLNLATGASTLQDANGNQITSSTSSGTTTYTDTLGTTALTASGSGTATSPLSFQYTSPAGAEFYAVNYTQFTVKTNFGVSGVSGEYGPLANPLVSSIQLPDGSEYQFTYEKTPGSCSPLQNTYQTNCVTGRIAEVIVPGGGTISYTYSGGPNCAGANGICSDGSTASLSRQLNPGGTWTYSRNDVSGTHWQTTVTDPSSNQTLIDLQKDSATGAPTENFYETQRQVGQGTLSSTACSSTVTTNCLLSTTITCYNGNSISSPSNCPTTTVSSQITQTTVFRYLPNSSGAQAETNTTINSYGLTSEVDEYDYGLGAVGALIRKTITTYNTSLNNGIVDRASTVSIKNASNTVLASTSYTYDGSTPTPSSGTPQHVSITGSRGLLTGVTAEVNGTTNLYRTYSYYDTGNLLTSTDVSTSSTINGATTTYNYASGTASCGNSFVTSITEPLSLSRSMTWDCNGGVMLSLTDENNNTSSTAYSGSNYTNYFWRPYSTTDQAGSVTNYFYYLNSSTPPNPFQTESKSATFNSGNSIVDVLTTTDGFGRTAFRQTRQGPSSSNYDTTATCYDTSGRVSLTTLPYSATAITYGTTCPSSNYGTSYTYDALNRQSTVSDGGGGQTAYQYTDNDTLQTLTSPTQSKQMEYDGLGRLKSVCEINSGTTAFPSGTCSQNSHQTGYWTTYTYDVLGDLTGVTQNAQASSGHQTRSYTYDMLGRLTQETNPETSNSATNYTYDTLSSDASCGTYTSAGNMVKRLDPAQNASCYSGYDALHRVGTITYPSTSTQAKHFVYDAGTVNSTSMSNAKTRLAEAYTCTGTCSGKVTDLFFSYWPTGQTTDVWELTPNSGTNYYYHVTSDPWPNGVMNTLQNLSGLPNLTYLTDGEGRLETASDSGGNNPVTAITYNPASQVTALTYGSGDSDSLEFYATTGRMEQYQFTVGSSPKTVTGVLTWNPNGTLETLTITDQLNSLNSQTCNYTHDALGRVASANCGSSIWSQDFSYDPFGNITKTVPTGATGTAFQPTYDYTNYTNQITSAPFTYNGKLGDVTADNSHSYTWDTDGHVTAIDSGSNGVCLTYDALGRAVEKDTGSTCSSATEVVYGPSGSKLALMNGSSLVKAFVPLPGGAEAVYNSSGLQYYRHPDWLGSSRLATTPGRTVYFDGAYAPFGENYAQSGTQDLSFTGQNQDTESAGAGGAGGLYDFLYREHSPVQGRWLSPDPLGLAASSPSDPQSWNRYAYVGNRPLTATDPQGMYWGCDPFSGICNPMPCDPSDPDCGGPGPGPCGVGVCPIPPPLPPPGGGPPPPPPNNPGNGGNPPQTGGVWPGNETTGLPGLDTSPLGTGNLLTLLPGLGCGGGGGLGLDFTTSTGQSPQDQCVLIVPPAVVIAAIAADNEAESNTSDWPKIAIAVGSYKLLTEVGEKCFYTLSCPNGNSSYTCGDTGTFIKDAGPYGCYPYFVTKNLVLVTSGRQCIGTGFGYGLSEPVPCD